MFMHHIIDGAACSYYMGSCSRLVVKGPVLPQTSKHGFYYAICSLDAVPCLWEDHIVAVFWRANFWCGQNRCDQIGFLYISGITCNKKIINNIIFQIPADWIQGVWRGGEWRWWLVELKCFFFTFYNISVFQHRFHMYV